MEKKTLEKILNYLPVIQTTCNRYGWDGRRARPIEKGTVTDTRKFFDYLSSHIPLQDTPDLKDVYGDPMGCITLLWESELNPEEATFDSFEITLGGDGFLGYSGTLDSTGTEAHGGVELLPELCPKIIEHIKFFKRKEDEQEQVPKPSAHEPTVDEQVQQKV